MTENNLISQNLKKKSMIVYLLTEDLHLYLNSQKNQVGGMTKFLINAIHSKALTATIRGDTRFRKFENSARLNIDFINEMDRIAVKRGCSRATLINSCINACLAEEKQVITLS